MEYNVFGGKGFENNVAKSYNTIAVAPFTNMV